MKILYKIQNKIIERIKVYVWDTKDITGFGTNYQILEGCNPTYIKVTKNGINLGYKGYEADIKDLDLFELVRLFKYIIKTQRNKY